MINQRKTDFFDNDPQSGGTLLGVETVDQRLYPGQYADISHTLEHQWEGLHTLYVIADDDGTGKGAHLEVNETNNTAHATFNFDNAPPEITSSPKSSPSGHSYALSLETNTITSYESICSKYASNILVG